MIIKNDRHFYRLEVTNGMEIKIDSFEVSLTPGFYWAHHDSTLNTTYPSIYIMIASRLAAVAGGTWEVLPYKPPGYTLRSGIRLRKITGTAPTLIDFSETSSLIQKVLGFSGSETGTKAFEGSYLNGEFAAYGSWTPYSFFEGRAESKDSYMDRISNWSTTHPEVAEAVVWRERRTRLLSYPYVFGCYVNQNRSQFDYLAEQAGCALNDPNNSFENLWMVHGRNLSDVIVAYDMEDIDLKVTTWDYEIVKLATPDLTKSMDKIASRVMLGADVWNVRVPYVVIGGSGYGL